MELNAEGHSHARAKLPSKDYEVLAKLKKVLTLELLKLLQRISPFK